MHTKIVQTFANIKSIVVTYPLFLFCALVLMLSIQALIDSAYAESFTLIKIAFTAGIGISLSFGVALLGQRNDKKRLWTLLTLGFLFAFFFLVLPEKEKDFTEYYVFILLPSYILSHLFVSIAPFLSHKSDEHRFWEYNKTLFINFFLTAVFTGVLCGGVQLALLAMDQLLGMNLGSEIYIRIFFGLLILGSAVIFALFHVGGIENMENPRPYPAVIAFFTQFILIPLLLLYASILYIYGLKIIGTWELPKGWVSYLVLIYGMLGILALLLVHPLLDGKSRAWVAWFRRLYYYSLAPLLVLLFIAICTRISQYGFTEPRYFVLLLALWLSFITLYFILFTKTSIKTIPYSLLIAGIAVLITPFINVFDVSNRSQKKTFKELLERNMLLENGKVNTSQPVSNTIVRDLQDKYMYLYKRNEEEYILTLLDEKSLKKMKRFSSSLREIFETIVVDSKEKEHLYLELTNNNTVREIMPYSYLVNMEYLDDLKFSIQTDSFTIEKRMYDENILFNFTINDSIKDLLPLIDSLVAPHIHTQIDQELDEISVVFRHEGYVCKLVMDQISINIIKGNKTYYFKNPTFLIRKE